MVGQAYSSYNQPVTNHNLSQCAIIGLFLIIIFVLFTTIQVHYHQVTSAGIQIRDHEITSRLQLALDKGALTLRAQPEYKAHAAHEF